MIVYLARDIQAFVMYCVNEASRSSLLIESTDSMIVKVEFSHIYYKSIIVFVCYVEAMKCSRKKQRTI